MTHAHLTNPLTESAKIISNVFSSCRESLLDLDEREHMALATAVASDLIASMVQRASDPEDLRAALTTIAAHCAEHLEMQGHRSTETA